MANINDGGPAFPHETQETVMVGTMTGTKRRDFAGMSLRDYLAAKALEGWISNGAIARIVETQQISPNGAETVLADSCYRLADAMLRARAAQSPADIQRAHLETFGK